MAATNFGRQLSRWAELVGEDIDDVTRATTLQLFSGVINRTPVDTGRLRGNWQASLDTPASGTTERTGEAGALAEARAVTALAPSNAYFLTNNLPYAAVAEFGLWGTGDGATNKTTRDGYSIQAPYGMVRVTVAEFQQALRRQIRNAQARARRNRLR